MSPPSIALDGLKLIFDDGDMDSDAALGHRAAHPDLHRSSDAGRIAKTRRGGARVDHPSEPRATIGLSDQISEFFRRNLTWFLGVGLALLAASGHFRDARPHRDAPLAAGSRQVQKEIDQIDRRKPPAAETA